MRRKMLLLYLFDGGMLLFYVLVYRRHIYTLLRTSDVHKIYKIV